MIIELSSIGTAFTAACAREEGVNSSHTTSQELPETVFTILLPAAGRLKHMMELLQGNLMVS